MQPKQHKWNAEDYARHSSAQLQWAQELIAKLALRGRESVLDIGCGDGKITAQLAQALGNGIVLGIDQSEDMIRLASERFPSAKRPNLSFRRMDATAINLSDRFDVAFSNAALHWVKDQMAVLRGVHACLKSGGKILFQMGGRGNADDVFDAIETVLRKPLWLPHYENFVLPYHFCGPEEYRVLLLDAGFCPVRVDLLPKDMKHDGTEGFKGWLRTTWFPYTDCLPVERRDAFLEEVVETYAAENPSDSFGNVHVKMVRLEVEAYSI